MTISNLIYSLFGNAEGSIDKTAVWTATLVFTTLILALVAYVQLSNIKKTARAEYIKRLNDSFFTAETRNLLVLLFNSAIEFDILSIKDKEGKIEIDKLPYFRIREFVLDQLVANGLLSLEKWRKGYNAFEIDDLLLGPLDIGRFERKDLVDFHSAESTFGYYIRELVGKNEEVKKFLDDEGSQGNYDDLEYIYAEVVSYEQMRNECWCVRKLWSFWHLLKKRKANIGIGQKKNTSCLTSKKSSGRRIASF